MNWTDLLLNENTFTAEDVNFCLKQYKAQVLNAKGVYYPVGPLVMIERDIPQNITNPNVDPSQSLSDKLPSDVITHEFLHHRHLMSSSIGLLELYFTNATKGAHLRLAVKNNRSLPFTQPYVERLADEKNDKEIMLLLILSIFYLRRIFSGYKLSDKSQCYFPETISKAVKVFKIFMDFTFPGTMNIYENLKEVELTNTMSAAPEYELNWFVGAMHILEGFAVDVMGGISGSNWKRGSGRPHQDISYEEVRNGDFEKYKYDGMRMLIDKKYIEAFLSGKSGSQVGTHIAFNELAMNPAIIPSQLHLWNRQPLWHDLQPGYRFFKLCHAIEHIGCCPHLQGAQSQQNKQVIEYMERATEYLKWPSYVETINSLCELEISNQFDLMFMGTGASQVKILAKMKKENFLPYVLGEHMDETGCSHAAVLDSNANHYYMLEGKDWLTVMYPTIMSIMLNEFYFSDSLTFTAKLLSPLADVELTILVESLEVNSCIKGIGDALFMEIQNVRRINKEQKVRKNSRRRR